MLELQKKKHVYVLASHSHFYMDRLFDDIRLDIVCRDGLLEQQAPYDILPPHLIPAPEHSRTLWLFAGHGEVNGEIDFDFKEVKESDVPGWCTETLPFCIPDWCFAHNSQHKDPYLRKPPTIVARRRPVVPSNAG